MTEEEFKRLIKRYVEGRVPAYLIDMGEREKEDKEEAEIL